ncbi:M20/M25/M40 family metallo-hydrolase [Billgrantia gudaonensis]|uniref:M20/M25/M40 family metallo-hydrolase n=1 Tax=Billgrantia gudaonensis TaxID=376427 RepID=A0A432JJP3_9GAMM|nr:M20/M25/M40 family metallo-hydrolase [Halomonas gudaonensis]
MSTTRPWAKGARALGYAGSAGWADALQRPSSRRISSRGRFSRTRASRSASSPRAQASAGTDHPHRSGIACRPRRCQPPRRPAGRRRHGQSYRHGQPAQRLRHGGPDAGLPQLAQRHFPARCSSPWTSAIPMPRYSRPWTLRYARERRAAEDIGLEMDFEPIWHSPPVPFDGDCVASVRKAAEALGLSHREMVSGAGHDACYIARVSPTLDDLRALRKGISHNELERADADDLAAGCDVLLQAVLNVPTRDGHSIIRRTTMRLSVMRNATGTGWP